MDNSKGVSSVFIEDEMQKSYLAYSMSMITSRALPDVRDGLKPVHRRVLYAMEALSLYHSKPYKKCARVVGDVIGKYHPHGDSAVYDALVRMAQDFSMRYKIVEGQGNFGSVDGDPPAAMRYTECRMARITEDMLADMQKETVDFRPNYDESMEEPCILPARIPYLLVNGSTGIAVGMATNMAPHNMGEVVDAIEAVLDNPDLEPKDILQYIPGPDFPTGGILYGTSGVKKAYLTGNGKAIVRARAEIESEPNGRERIIVSEIPYMVNKSTLLEKMASLVKEDRVNGISFLRDESDRSGMRIVIGIKKDSYGDVVLNQLYKYTALQNTFGINNLALVDGQPRLLNIKELIDCFITHRHDIILRRLRFELRKAEERAHILEGLLKALKNIDEVVNTIKSSSSPEEAKVSLIEKFVLSEIQAKAILDMRLQRLTGLEREKLESEYNELKKTIEEINGILQSRDRQMAIIKEELIEIKSKYGDKRRTEIVEAEYDVQIEDLIADEDMVVTMTKGGYIKRCALTSYRAQGRGGRGVRGMASKDEDLVTTLFVASAHSYIMFFTNKGRCLWLKVYQIPETQRNSRGRSIVNLLNLREGETVASHVTVKDFDSSHFLIIATRKGIVNKQPLKAYSNVRKGGINAVNLDEDDKLISCRLTDGDKDVMIATKNGRAVRFHESATRELGRNTRGMKGISLKNGDSVVGMIVVKSEEKVLCVTENGYGKRTMVSEYRKTNRGGSGIINIKCTQKNGKVVGCFADNGGKDLMIITKNGIIIRIDAEKISVISRNTQGVRLINLGKDDSVVDVAMCDKDSEEDKVNTEETE